MERRVYQIITRVPRVGKAARHAPRGLPYRGRGGCADVVRQLDDIYDTERADR